MVECLRRRGRVNNGILFYLNIYYNLPNGHEDSDIHQLLENLFGFEPNVEIPSEFKLHQNRPNPFNPTTKIVYEIPTSSNVIITISNILGEVVFENQLGIKEPGIYSFDFDGSNISSGVYFYQLESSNGTIIKNKMMKKPIINFITKNMISVF